MGLMVIRIVIVIAIQRINEMTEDFGVLAGVSLVVLAIMSPFITMSCSGVKTEQVEMEKAGMEQVVELSTNEVGHITYHTLWKKVK